MNLNQLLNEILNTATGLDISQDEYDGKNDKYIVYTYMDEKPIASADNRPIAYMAYMQIQLITPKKFNYFTLKAQIIEALEENGFTITSISSILGDEIQGTEKIRQTIFEAEYAKGK